MVILVTHTRDSQSICCGKLLRYMRSSTCGHDGRTNDAPNIPLAFKWWLSALSRRKIKLKGIIIAMLGLVVGALGFLQGIILLLPMLGARLLCAEI